MWLLMLLILLALPFFQFCTLLGLSGRRRQLCRREAVMGTLIQHAATLALHECQHQMKEQRWNCNLQQNKLAILNKSKVYSSEITIHYFPIKQLSLL